MHFTSDMAYAVLRDVLLVFRPTVYRQTDCNNNRG